LAHVLSAFGPLWASPRAQYDGAASAANVPGTCVGWSPGPRKVWQMPRAFGRGHGVSIPHQRRGNWPLFRQLVALCVYRPGHKRRGGVCFKPAWYVRRVVLSAPRLHQTDVVRVQGGSQGPVRSGRCFGSLAGCMGRISNTKEERFALVWPTFSALCASTRAQYDGAAAASNRPGTCAGWLSGFRQVWQMLWTLGWGTRRRSRAKDEESGSCFVDLWPYVCIAQRTYDGAAAALTRRGMYEGRVVPRAPGGVSDASGLRQRARGADPAPEAGWLALFHEC
jgi:hypothetical protein